MKKIKGLKVSCKQCGAWCTVYEYTGHYLHKCNECDFTEKMPKVAAEDFKKAFGIDP